MKITIAPDRTQYHQSLALFLRGCIQDNDTQPFVSQQFSTFLFFYFYQSIKQDCTDISLGFRFAPTSLLLQGPNKYLKTQKKLLDTTLVGAFGTQAGVQPCARPRVCCHGWPLPGSLAWRSLQQV